MSELVEAKTAFLQAVKASSDLPGMNDINLAMATIALLKAEQIAPDSQETRCMQAVFAQLGRQDAYEAVKRMISLWPPQP